MSLFKATPGRHMHGGTWSTFVLGSLFGFFVASTFSGILSLHIFSDEQTQSMEVTTHALRQLAKLRHFPETNGWGLVHVFYGNNSHLPQGASDRANNWFERHQADYIISKILKGKRKGYFVDLTAGHAYESSKTYMLETNYDWKGLCVEPDPRHWESLSFRKCDVVGALEGESRMEETERSHTQSASYDARLRYTVPLREILERFEGPRVIDYLCTKEGRHLSLKNFPFDRYRFNVISIDKPTLELQQTLYRNGYFKLLELRQSEVLWIHQSIQHTIDKDTLSTTAESLNLNEALPAGARN